MMKNRSGLLALLSGVARVVCLSPAVFACSRAAVAPVDAGVDASADARGVADGTSDGHPLKDDANALLDLALGVPNTDILTFMHPGLSLVETARESSIRSSRRRACRRINANPITMDGHDIFAQLDQVKYQYGCFLSTMLRTGTAIAPAAAPLGKPCPTK